MSDPGGQQSTGATASNGPTHAEDYPTIAGWLASAGPEHPWQRLLSTPVAPGVSRPTVADTMLGPLEVMALIVAKAGPDGLGSFITQFRDADMKNVLGRRLELLCAFNLTVQQLPYAFGQTSQPDFVWQRGGPQQGWLEVTRATFDAFDQLRSDLQAEAEQRDVHLRFSVDTWPLRFTNRNLLVTQICNLMDAVQRSQHEQHIPLPDLGDGASVTAQPGPPPGLSRVSVSHGGLSPTPEYMDDFAAKLAEFIEQKEGQGRRGRWPTATALLIDVSTARFGLLQDDSELAAWLDAIAVDWEHSPFACVAISYSHMQGLVLRGVCRYRPDLDPVIRGALEPVLTTMGMPPTG
jgi:hypothetical protein